MEKFSLARKQVNMQSFGGRGTSNIFQSRNMNRILRLSPSPPKVINVDSQDSSDADAIEVDSEDTQIHAPPPPVCHPPIIDIHEIEDPISQTQEDPIDISSQDQYSGLTQAVPEDIDSAASSEIEDNIIGMTFSQQRTLQQIQDIAEMSQNHDIKELDALGNNSIDVDPNATPEFHDAEPIDTLGASQFFETSRAVAVLLEDITNSASEWSFGFSRVLKVKIVESHLDAFEEDSEIIIVTSAIRVKPLKDVGQAFIMMEPFHAFPWEGNPCFLVPNCSVPM